jgi:SAM-dependent methyltransferase
MFSLPAHDPDPAPDLFCEGSRSGPGSRAGGILYNFDPIAPHYDRLERWFSRGLMHRARTAHLPFITRCRHALLLGEGPGRFLPLVLQQFPQIRATCIDSSARMLALARSHISNEDMRRVEFVEADIRDWKPAVQFDLIVANFFLDCFDSDTLDQIIPALASAATIDANWLIADFQLPEHGFARWRAAIVIGFLYRFFRLATGLSTQSLVPPDSSLEHSGFHLRSRVQFDYGLLRSDWWIQQPTPPSPAAGSVSGLCETTAPGS